MPIFSTTRRVAFYETDLAGIAHFSNFFRWMEEAEHAFLRSVGLSVHPLQQGGGNDVRTGWPRVSAKCDYHSPVHFEEVVEIRLSVVEIRTKSVRYRCHIHKTDEFATLAASGELAVVSVQADPTTRKMKAVPLPENFRKHLESLLVEAPVGS